MYEDGEKDWQKIYDYFYINKLHIICTAMSEKILEDNLFDDI